MAELHRINIAGHRCGRVINAVVTCLGFALILLGVLPGVLCANPENILVDKYTFIRPEAWKWQLSTNKSPALNRFIVPGTGERALTDVRFYLLAGARPDFRKRLLDNFSGVPETSEHTAKIGDREIIYFTGVGTVIDTVGKKEPPKPNYRYTCTMLPTDDPQKHLYIRIAGPQEEVEAAIRDFMQMVERALKESI